jgi:ABC-type glycerol-3-phosphate transport system permease component
VTHRTGVERALFVYAPLVFALVFLLGPFYWMVITALMPTFELYDVERSSLYVYALTLVTASSERTIPVGVLVQLTRADFYFWGPLMAGALAGSIPVALIYSFFVDQYAAGLTAGAVKG